MTNEQKFKISRTLKSKYANGLVSGFQRNHPPYNFMLKKWRENGGEPWNKGLTGNKSHSFGKIFSEERRKKIAEKLKGNKNARSWKHKVTDKHRESYRKRRLKQIFLKADTKLEKTLKVFLAQKGIEFRSQYPLLGKYLADVFIKPNIVVEADGKYWHSRPDVLARDEKRDEELAKNGFTTIRFSEEEIKNDINQCWIRLHRRLVLTSEDK